MEITEQVKRSVCRQAAAWAHAIGCQPAARSPFNVGLAQSNGSATWGSPLRPISRIDNMLTSTTAEVAAGPAVLRRFTSVRCVACVPPLGGPARVLEYLGRYTHRVAITNSRLVDFSNGQVAFP